MPEVVAKALHAKEVKQKVVKAKIKNIPMRLADYDIFDVKSPHIFDLDILPWVMLYTWYVPLTNEKIFTLMLAGAKITLLNYVSLFYRSNANIVGFKDGNSFNLKFDNLIFEVAQTPFHRLIKTMSRVAVERKTTMKYTFESPYTLEIEYFDPLTHCQFSKVYTLASTGDKTRAEIFLTQKLIQIRTLRMMHHTA